MGGGQSTEQDAYDVIKWIPGLGQVYSAGRAIAKAIEGDDQGAINSVMGIVGIAGQGALAIRESGLFDNRSTDKKEWVGKKQQVRQIPSNYWDGHLFDTSKYMYFFDEIVSNEDLELFKLSRDDIRVVEGDNTNVPPALRDGSSEISYYDAINTGVVLTSYLIAFSNKSRQAAVFVTTFKWHSSNIFNWSKLNKTKNEDIEAVLRVYRDSARNSNRNRMAEVIKIDF